MKERLVRFGPVILGALCAPLALIYRLCLYRFEPDPLEGAALFGASLVILLAVAVIIGVFWMARAALRDERAGEVTIWAFIAPWVFFAMGHAVIAITPARAPLGVQVTPMQEGLPSPAPRMLLLRQDLSNKRILAMSEDRTLWLRENKTWRELGASAPEDAIDLAIKGDAVHILEADLHVRRLDLQGEVLSTHDLPSLLLDYQCHYLQKEEPDFYADFPCDRLRMEDLLQYQRDGEMSWGTRTGWLTLLQRTLRQSFCGFEELALGVMRVRVDQSSIKLHYCPYDPGDDTLSIVWDGEQNHWKISQARGTRIITRFRQPRRAGSGPCTIESLWIKDNFRRAFLLQSKKNKRDRERVEVLGPRLWLDNGDMLDMGLERMIYYRIDEACQISEILPITIPGMSIVEDPSKNHSSTPHPRHDALLLEREPRDESLGMIFAPADGGVASARASLHGDNDPWTSWRARATRIRMELEERRPARRSRYLRALLFTFHLIGWILLGKRLWKRRSPERGE